MDTQRLQAKIAELEAQVDILRTVAAACRDTVLGPVLRSLFARGETLPAPRRQRTRTRARRRATKAGVVSRIGLSGPVARRLQQVFSQHPGGMTGLELRTALGVEANQVHQWLYQYKAYIQRRYDPALSPHRYYSWVAPAVPPADTPDAAATAPAVD